jgi:predicted nucleotidyltransferase
MNFRDRDAPVTNSGLIFRTYGYDHPKDSCFCDLEYAPEYLYRTDDPRAVRDGLSKKYFKFYFDSGLKFALGNNPPYRIHHKALDRIMVGVKKSDVSFVVRPERKLQELFVYAEDPLQKTCVEIVDLLTDSSSLKESDLGIFGSLAHDFHNPKFSDVDLIVYGSRELKELRSTLKDLFNSQIFSNEFERWTIQDPPAHWNFKYLSKKQYGFLQKRKGIYAIYHASNLGRYVKIEFEPVRQWGEIHNKYEKTISIKNLGCIKASGVVVSDDSSGFMPSLYHVKLDNITFDIDPEEVEYILSFVEEFRLQVVKGERFIVRGNLEEIKTRNRRFYQITLSYGKNYFEQVLKPQSIEYI